MNRQIWLSARLSDTFGNEASMSEMLTPSQAIARERARRQALKERQENMSMSAQIAREIERRKQERARCKARLKLVIPGGQQEETRESEKNREEG